MTLFFILERNLLAKDRDRDPSWSRYIDSTKNACFNEFMCRSQVELLVKKPWNALRTIFNALWSVASCTNNRRQTTLRPISMSTTAWNGVHFRTIVVCQNWRKQPHTSELISSLRGACTYRRVSLFASVPSNLLAFTCARALTPNEKPLLRHHRERRATEFGGPAEWGQENPPAEKLPKKRPVADTIFSC